MRIDVTKRREKLCNMIAKDPTPSRLLSIATALGMALVLRVEEEEAFDSVLEAAENSADLYEAGYRVTNDQSNTNF